MAAALACQAAGRCRYLANHSACAIPLIALTEPPVPPLLISGILMNSGLGLPVAGFEAVRLSLGLNCLLTWQEAGNV